MNILPQPFLSLRHMCFKAIATQVNDSKDFDEDLTDQFKALKNDSLKKHNHLPPTDRSDIKLRYHIASSFLWHKNCKFPLNRYKFDSGQETGSCN